MQVLTPIALGRLVHPLHTWGRFHLAIQAALLQLLTKQLRFPASHPKAGQVCKRLMILVPPQHGKSTLSSQLFPAICFAQNPATKLILLSYSADLAGAHSLVARDRVIEHGATLCPSGALRLNPDAKARNAWYTTAGGYMRAASIQGTVTGIAAHGILIDDPFKGTEDSASPTVREKVWRTYTATAETRLAPDGFVCLVGTPWHEDDLRGRLLATEADDWIVLRFPALAEVDDVLGRLPGAPLFPESGRTLEWYEAARRKFELRGLSHLWDALYQCQPSGDASLRAFNDPSYFADHIWVQGLPLTERNAQVHRVLALDPSKSKTGKVGDYGAFCDMTLLADRHLYCQMHLARETLPALYARAVAIVKAAKQEGRPYQRFLIEVNQFQEAVALAIQEHLRTAGCEVPIEMHNTPSDQSKHARIQVDLGPLLAQKRLHFVGKSVPNVLTVQQMKEIPNGAHDDGPDSVSMATQALNLLLTGTKRPHQQTVLR